jgi:hypothetical protein
MAGFDYRRLAQRAAGRPVVPEYTSVTGVATSATVALTDRKGQEIVGEDMVANVFDTSTSPWTDISAKFTINPGNGLTSTDGTGNGHTLLVVWYKFRPGLG